MALGGIDFYSPVAKGFAAGFFCGDFGGRFCKLGLFGFVLTKCPFSFFHCNSLF
jgi:hypothetical protein